MAEVILKEMLKGSVTWPSPLHVPRYAKPNHAICHRYIKILSSHIALEYGGVVPMCRSKLLSQSLKLEIAVSFRTWVYIHQTEISWSIHFFIWKGSLGKFASPDQMVGWMYHLVTYIHNNCVYYNFFQSLWCYLNWTLPKIPGHRKKLEVSWVRHSRSKLLFVLFYSVWPWFLSRALNYVPLGHLLYFNINFNSLLQNLASFNTDQTGQTLFTNDYVKSVYSTQNNFTWILAFWALLGLQNIHNCDFFFCITYHYL